MQVETIQSDCYLAVGDAYDSNSTIFLSQGEALLIDALGSGRDAEELKRFIEEDLKATVRFVVCTHYFSDHLAALKLFPESWIIAHENYRYTFDRELNRTEEEKSFFVEPSILISDRMSIRWGDFSLNIFYNPGHTMSTLNVDIPEADLIHVGDTIVGNMAYIRYSTLPMFFPALERIRGRGRHNLISSHWSVRPAVAVDHAEYYLRTLEKKAGNAGDDAALMGKIDLDGCLPEGVMGTPFEMMFHKRNLQFLSEVKPHLLEAGVGSIS